ncbi:F-box protein PP2-B15-like [Populus alba x Populus x berolinensis]|uniref:F-box protein PP2-B15-like n=1 Tax=Populus alba x Populus x berolinensis TaxID=444605 RepID=A0AAD6Q1Z0_9ROSI|nr:F-box protein PP2-B15-like [Populus alba x Populus x berolinensis]
MEGLMDRHEFNILPEGCVSTILSFTSPQDACKSSLVSAIFQAAADSDVVWERFLPTDYQDIVSRSMVPFKFSSKKELFLLLCSSLLIDGGRKSFKLERSSGKKSFMLSARDLHITWSDESPYWHWASLPESRFSEVAVLRTMCWLEIVGMIKTQMLTPNTKYGAYLVLKITDRSYGLDLMPSEISVEVLKSRVAEGEGRVPSERDDGWLEIELGEFFSGENDEEVKMSLMEVKGHHLKGGLIIEGIEIRPKH